MDTKVLIVGGGLSGLVAAKQLKVAGVDSTIVDKGRSTGGRLATRRIGDGQADHGAQFFTVRTTEFQEQVDAWLADDIIQVWGYGWTDGSLKRTVNDGHPRYIANGGMNQLARNLEASADVIHTNTQIESIEYKEDHWLLRDTNNQFYTSRILIMTPPVPQSLELLKDVPLTDSDRESLECITYGPCLCGMHLIDGEVDLPEPGAAQDFSQMVYWIADNKRKGLSNQPLLTTHAESRWSKQFYDSPDGEILEELRKAIQPYLKTGARIVEEQVKRWQYSVPLTTHSADFMKATDLPLIFAGDAFGGRGRIEGAYLSGLAAGQFAVNLIK